MFRGFRVSGLKRFLLASTATVAVFTPLYLSSKPSILLESIAAIDKKEEESRFLEWKKNKIGNYENRLRDFSHPLKPRDFIRSLIRHRSFIDSSNSTRVPSAEEFFSLADTNGDGLIDFNEYIMFLTLLGTPEYHWKISFKLFDTNGDGTVSYDEFTKLVTHHTKGLAFGKRIGDQEMGGINSGFARLLFGKKGEKSIDINQFSDFMKRLNYEVLKLEFYQFQVENNSISMKDFAKSIISYLHENQTKQFEKRLEKISEYTERVTFAQFFSFNHLLSTRIHDLGAAYSFHSSISSKKGFKKIEFQKMVKNLTKCELSNGQVDVLYELFDSDGDGELDCDEFYKVIKRRSDKGLSGEVSDNSNLFSYLKKTVDCLKNIE